MKHALLFLVGLTATLALHAQAPTPAPAAPPAASTREILAWQSLAPLPDPEGFAGSYAGISGGALLVAGGANFPDRRPWEGGTKVWHAPIFVLETPTGTWKTAGSLPRPAGYGLSLTLPEGVLLIGGGDATTHFSEVHLARWDGKTVTLESRPALPVGLSQHTGALVGRTVYVAGGLERPDSPQARNTVLTLNLDAPAEGWRTLEGGPDTGRFLATAGALDGAFYLFGGCRLVPGPDGRPQREPLRDAWRHTPGQGWTRLADLPTPLIASPGPAPAMGPSHLLLIGGDDGSRTGPAAAQHPGFPRTLWAYHTLTDSWAQMGTLPFSLVTTPVVTWQGRFVVPGGERQPGLRSPAVWSAVAAPHAPKLGTVNYITIALYLGLMVAMGVWFARRQKGTEDYFRAGRRVPWWAVSLSIYATLLSSITFMAVPAKAYATNWTFTVANVASLLLVPIVIRYYLPFFRRLDVTSAYEYLEHRFNLPVRLYASAAFVLFQCGRMAIVIFLPSLALSAAMGLNVYLCIVLIGALCVVYTAFGGMEAVIWTDVVQAVVLLGVAILSLFLIVTRVDGGLSGLWTEAMAYDKLRMFDWRWDATAAVVWVIVIGNLFSNLTPYTADQTVVQRYMVTRNEKQAARAIWTNAWLGLGSTFVFFGIGTALFVFYRQHPQYLEPALGTDAVFPLFMAQFLPPGIAGLAIAGIFAAAQSTVSSSLNSMVAALTTDFYRRFRPNAPDQSCLRLARWLTVGLGIFGTAVAWIMAGADIRSLWDTYLGLLGLLGSGLAGLFALGIFTTRTNGAGALVGVGVSAVVLYWVQRHTSLHFFLYAVVGIGVCCSVGWLASLVLPSRPKDLTGLSWSTRVRDEPAATDH